MHSVTKQAIREARLKEIKEELLHSEKLKVRAGGGSASLPGCPELNQPRSAEQQREAEEGTWADSPRGVSLLTGGQWAQRVVDTPVLGRVAGSHVL